MYFNSYYHIMNNRLYLAAKVTHTTQLYVAYSFTGTEETSF